MSTETDPMERAIRDAQNGSMVAKVAITAATSPDWGGWPKPYVETACKEYGLTPYPVKVRA